MHPSPEERWSIAIRRVGLLLLALLVSEAVIAWASRQRQAATKLADEYKREGWTITHGFFAIMGGFMEYEGNRPIRTARIVFSDGLSKDKSKRETPFPKGLVILQTSWSVTQCIARGIQGLPITESELVIVAFAALNFVIYLFVVAQTCQCAAWGASMQETTD